MYKHSMLKYINKSIYLLISIQFLYISKPMQLKSNAVQILKGSCVKLDLF